MGRKCELESWTQHWHIQGKKRAQNIPESYYPHDTSVRPWGSDHEPVEQSEKIIRIIETTTCLLYFSTAWFVMYTFVYKGKSRFMMKCIIKSCIPYCPALDLQTCRLNKLPLDASALNTFGFIQKQMVCFVFWLYTDFLVNSADWPTGIVLVNLVDPLAAARTDSRWGRGWCDSGFFSRTRLNLAATPDFDRLNEIQWHTN